MKQNKENFYESFYEMEKQRKESLISDISKKSNDFNIIYLQFKSEAKIKYYTEKGITINTCGDKVLENKIKFNIFKIPKNVPPLNWIKIISDIFALVYNYNNERKFITDSIKKIYIEEKVVDENLNILDIEKSKNINFDKLYNAIINNDNIDYWNRFSLSKKDFVSSFKNRFSIENSYFCSSEGIGIDEYLENKNMKILNFWGLEINFLKFINLLILFGLLEYTRFNKQNKNIVLLLDEGEENDLMNDFISWKTVKRFAKENNLYIQFIK